MKLLSDVTVSCPKVSTHDVLNNNDNKTSFPELKKVLEEAFEIKVQEG